MNEPMYLKRGVGLPSMGVSPRGPRQLTAADVDAIMACTDTAGLAELKAYSRSYFAMAGMIVLGTGAAVAAALRSRPGLTPVGISLAAAAALGVIEARRRAREWEAVADARLGLLSGTVDGAPATMSS